MSFAQTPNGKIHYEVDGKGPGLVMVHGTGGDAEKVFGNIVGQFTSEYTVVRPNLSGSGKTTDDGSELTVAGLTDQILTATQDAVDGPVDLLGFSLGAVVAAAAAATRPDLVRRLILIGGWAHTTGPRDAYYFQTWKQLAATDRQLLKRFSALTGFSTATLNSFGHDGLAASLADEWPPEGMARQIDLGVRVDIRRLLPAISAPTLVIGLGSDQMVPMEGSRQLHAAISGSRLAEIQGAGHMDWFIEPEPIVALTKKFLGEKS